MMCSEIQTAKIFERTYFRASGVKSIVPLYFKTERVAETPLSASWFWLTSGGYSRNLGDISSSFDAKLSRDGLVLQWNGHSKTF